MSKIIRAILQCLPLKFIYSIRSDIEIVLIRYLRKQDDIARAEGSKGMKQYLANNPDLELELQYSPLPVINCGKHGNPYTFTALRLNKLRRLTKELHGIQDE